MAIDPNKLRIIIQWITKLGETARMRAEDGWTEHKAEVVLRTFADFLYADFNSACFTQASLHAILTQNEFFPSYKRLHEQLSAWWAENRPPPPATLEAPGTANLRPEDKIDIRVWTNHKINGMPETAGHGQESLTGQLDLSRRFFPASFQWLIHNDATAAAIARRRGWMPEDDGGFSEEATRNTLENLRDHPMRASLLPAYRSLLERRAPHLLHLVDEFAPQPEPAPIEEATSRPAHPSSTSIDAATLGALYQKAGARNPRQQAAGAAQYPERDVEPAAPC
jgi:hypothetical protein